MTGAKSQPDKAVDLDPQWLTAARMQDFAARYQPDHTGYANPELKQERAFDPTKNLADWALVAHRKRYGKAHPADEEVDCEGLLITFWKNPRWFAQRLGYYYITPDHARALADHYVAVDKYTFDADYEKLDRVWSTAVELLHYAQLLQIEPVSELAQLILKGVTDTRTRVSSLEKRAKTQQDTYDCQSDNGAYSDNEDRMSTTSSASRNSDHRNNNNSPAPKVTMAAANADLIKEMEATLGASGSFTLPCNPQQEAFNSTHLTGMLAKAEEALYTHPTTGRPLPTTTSETHKAEKQLQTDLRPFASNISERGFQVAADLPAFVLCLLQGNYALRYGTDSYRIAVIVLVDLLDKTAKEAKNSNAKNAANAFRQATGVMSSSRVTHMLLAASTYFRSDAQVQRWQQITNPDISPRGLCYTENNDSECNPRPFIYKLMAAAVNLNPDITVREFLDKMVGHMKHQRPQVATFIYAQPEITEMPKNEKLLKHDTQTTIIQLIERYCKDTPAQPETRTFPTNNKPTYKEKVNSSQFDLRNRINKHTDLRERINYRPANDLRHRLNGMHNHHTGRPHLPPNGYRTVNGPPRPAPYPRPKYGNKAPYGRDGNNANGNNNTGNNNNGNRNNANNIRGGKDKRGGANPAAPKN